MPARAEIEQLTPIDCVGVTAIALAVAMQCIGSWRHKFYRVNNRRRIDALVNDIDRVSAQFTEEQAERLRRLTTILTESYQPTERPWDFIDPGDARLAVLAAGLTLRQLGPGWRRDYDRIVKRFRRRRRSNLDKVADATDLVD